MQLSSLLHSLKLALFLGALLILQTARSDASDKKWILKSERDVLSFTLFFGPNSSSVFYGGDLQFEHGKTSFTGAGGEFNLKLSKRLFLDGYFYYLPTEIREGSSGISFIGANAINYENNLYGLRVGYTFYGSRKYRLSFLAGGSLHIIGGIAPTSPTTVVFDKFDHNGVLLGLRLERKINRRWVFDSDLSYILPLSVDGPRDGDGKFWFRGILGIKRRISSSTRLFFEYQILNQESEFEFAGNFRSQPEFFVQTFMFGFKINLR